MRRHRVPLVIALVALVGTITAPLPAATAEEGDLPPPTGPHAVGRTTVHWIDGARDELESADPDDPRELVVHLFYPAAADGSGTPADYVPDAAEMVGAWGAAQLERIEAMRVHARDGADPLEGRFPVAIFQPGGGMKVLTYHALLEDLASHGWVVAALDPPYNALAVRLPDGRVLRRPPPGGSGWTDASDDEARMRAYLERNVHWARDVAFVLDELEALDAGRGPLAGRLALERGVGVVGHSRGGQAAATVRLLDDRVRGGVNLDGTLGELPVLPAYQGPGAAETYGTQPYLWIQTPIEAPTDAELAGIGRTRVDFEAAVADIVAGWHRRMGTIDGGAMRVVFGHPGIRHIDFSDEPFWDGSMTPESRPGKERTIADARAWVRAFLTGAVLGDWAWLDELTAGAARPGGDVTVHEIVPMGG